MKISVLGDSHSRVFSNGDIFTSFFLGPGSQFNIVDEHEKIDKRVGYLLNIIKDEFDKHIFVFGEPSCRYQIKKDHHIHKKKFNTLGFVDQDILQNITKKYINIIDKYHTILNNKLIIFAPISVYEPSIEFSKRFSKNLENHCKIKKISFIDIKDDIINPDGSIDEKYKADPVHASEKVLPYIQKRLSDIGVNFNINKSAGFNELMSTFNYDEKFKCFTLKNNI